MKIRSNLVADGTKGVAAPGAFRGVFDSHSGTLAGQSKGRAGAPSPAKDFALSADYLG